MDKSQTLLEKTSQEKADISKGSKFQLAGADGLRAIACLSVIFHHFAQKLAINLQTPQVQEIQGLLLLGNSGVSVFFVLSGFLLSYPFWKQYLNNGPYPSIKQYTIRRAARIVPGYYASLLLCTLIVILLNIPSPHFLIRFISGLTFTSGFHYITFFPNEINNPFWSISFEIFCYFLMPLFMFGLYKLFGKKRSFTKAFIYWLGIFAVVVGLNQLVHIFLTPENIQRGWQYGAIGGAKYWMPNYNPVGFFGHFTMGIFAAGISVKLFIEADRFRLFRKFLGFDLIGIACLAGSVVLLWRMRGLPDFAFSLQNQPYYFPLYAILMGATLAVSPQSRILGKILDNVFFRFTAKLSFGLYIWHYLIMYIVGTRGVKEFQAYMGIADIQMWAFVCIFVLVLSYAIAALSYQYIEKPVLDRVHKMTK